MKLNVKEVVLFGMLGTVMYISKIFMEILPNIHLLGPLIVAYTVVYRKKALYPIYVYVLLNGVTAGFATWWIPYLYVWTVLWAMVMLIPKNLRKNWQMPVYMSVCALHGFLFGVLYAPAQAILFGLSLKGMIAWIISGLPFDIIHGISNFCVGILIVPLVSLLRRADMICQ